MLNYSSRVNCDRAMTSELRKVFAHQDKQMYIDMKFSSIDCRLYTEGFVVLMKASTSVS